MALASSWRAGVLLLCLLVFAPPRAAAQVDSLASDTEAAYGLERLTGAWLVESGFGYRGLVTITGTMALVSGLEHGGEPTIFMFEISEQAGSMLVIEMMSEQGPLTLRLVASSEDEAIVWGDTFVGFAVLRRLHPLPAALWGVWQLEDVTSGEAPSTLELTEDRAIEADYRQVTRAYVFGSDGAPHELLLIDSDWGATEASARPLPDGVWLWASADEGSPHWVLYPPGERPDWLPDVSEMADGAFDGGLIGRFDHDSTDRDPAGTPHDEEWSDSVDEVGLGLMGSGTLDEGGRSGIGVLGALEGPSGLAELAPLETTIENPEANLRAIAAGAVAYYSRSTSEQAGFPASTTWTPTVDLCGGRHYDAAAWAQQTWEALGFRPSDPYHFQYRFISSESASGLHFEVQARIDRDCDGVYAKVTIDGRLQADGGVLVGETNHQQIDE